MQASIKEAEQLTARRYNDSLFISITLKLHLSHNLPPCCSKTLSQRVASYNQRVVAEGDALAEEVNDSPVLCMLSVCL